MGRNSRKSKKNKWKRGIEAGGENLRRRHLGSGSGSGTPADSEDDRKSYTTSSSGRSRKRGSGILRGEDRDEHSSSRYEAPVCIASPVNTNGDSGPPSTTFPAKAEISDRHPDEQQEYNTGKYVDERVVIDKKDVPPSVAGKGTGESCDGEGSNADGNVGFPETAHPSLVVSLTSSAGREVTVPALPLGGNPTNGGREGGSRHACTTAEAQAEAKRYSLAWARGKTGRRLMKCVEDVLSGWLCAQEAKGICVEEKITATSVLRTTYVASLEQLETQLDMPEAVVCALGLRLRGSEWEDLVEKIAAARDFLDLKAESTCSSALAAFGTQTSAPRPRDNIQIRDFVVLARKEAASLDLAELELRQALRAQASRVAPRFCPSAASFLFLEGLDPDATGSVATSDLAAFASRLLGFQPELCAERSTWAASHGGTFGAGSTGRRSSKAEYFGAAAPQFNASGGTTASSFRGSSTSTFDRTRARHFRCVIERLARTATTAGVDPTEGQACGNRDEEQTVAERFLHRDQARAQRGGPGRVGSDTGPDSREQTAAILTPTERASVSSARASLVRRKRESRGDSDKITITTFCRFVEGKRFDEGSLEGFVWALSRAGRLLGPSEGNCVAIEEGGRGGARGELTQGQAAHHARIGRGRVHSVRDGTWGTVATAMWGARGLRRASPQFAHSAQPTERSSIESFTRAAVVHSGGKKTTTTAQARNVVAQPPLARPVDVRAGIGGGSGGATSIGGAGNLSSRTGTSTTSSGVVKREGSLHTPRSSAFRPRGCDSVAEKLLSFDPNRSGTLSSEEFVAVANQVTGLPIRQEWADVLTARFAAGRHREGDEGGEVHEGGAGGLGGEGGRRGGGGGGGGGGVRWLGESGSCGNKSSRLEVAALVEFLRPKSFSLSVMTPFGLVELLLEGSSLTLGGLREIMVNKMFWRQHNCHIRRSDRDNFTLSRYYGALPLDTESPEQRRRLVLDVLRPGELIFVTDRAVHRSRQEESRSIPRFQYMMEARKQHAGAGSPGSGTNTRGAVGRAKLPSGRRKSSSAAAVTNATTSAPIQPQRRSSAPAPFSPPGLQLIGGSTDSTANSAKKLPGGSRLSSSSNGRKKSAVAPCQESQATGVMGSLSKTDVFEGALDEEGALSCGRESAGARGSEGYPGSLPAKEISSEPGCSAIIFDWTESQVERWISETLELGCYRETFRANNIGGLRLGGLTQDDLMNDLGVKNDFHARKVVLHLDRLMEKVLGSSSQANLPRRVESWRNREFLVWCWQHVGVRHRPTLALLHQAGIDGLVLLAMDSEKWDRFVETSPHPSCHAPLERIRRVSRKLPSQRGLGFPILHSDGYDSPEHDESVEPRTFVEGIDEQVATAGGTTKPPSAPVEIEGGQRPPENDRDGFEDKEASGGNRCRALVSGGGRSSHEQTSVSAYCVHGGNKTSIAAGYGAAEEIRPQLADLPAPAVVAG